MFLQKFSLPKVPPGPKTQKGGEEKSGEKGCTIKQIRVYGASIRIKFVYNVYQADA
jgi:hypothetical protein